VQQQVAAVARSGSPLAHAAVRQVRFNAWHYAETNLWASLVDEVLRKIGPAAPVSPPPEVGKAEELVTAKRESVRMVEKRVGEEERKLTRASRRQAWRSRLLLLPLLAIVLAVVAVVVWRLNGHDLWRGLTLTVGVLSAMLVVLRQAQQAAKEVRSVVTDGRERGRTLAKWGSDKDVDEAAQNLRIERRKLETAQAEADLALRAAAHAKEIASSTDLGSVLARVSGETEYRDQLSVITRTRERFKSIDKAVNAARDARKAKNAQAKPPTVPVEADNASTGSGTPSSEEQLDRVVIVIDDLDRCPPEKVVTVLEAVHLLFDFRIFVVILAVDTRWLEQSLLIRYRKLLGATAKASPADYLEKVIQIPLHLVHLDPGLVRRMLSGLTGAAVDASERAGGSDPDHVIRPEHDEGQAHERARLRGQRSRPERNAVPAQPLQISSAEAVAMSAVAPLIGTTPRTVKRFVNTYRLLKGRAFDAVAFDDRHEGLGDHEVVAFLLAVVTGHPVFAAHLLEALAREPRAHNLQQAVLDLELPAKPKSMNASKQAVLDWLTERRAFADGKVSRYAYWAVEVGRFSFSPPARVPVDGPAHGPHTGSMDPAG
ncbi:MAG TPA: P-loop NTPase fold protein, partial [Acidimicrobiales bacterium]|nr:P-loop NTPase fold protein [Acidimicrobiales bacterium]